jgi:hypothetical protein
MTLYEVHSNTAWNTRSSMFEVAVSSVRFISKLHPRRVFHISRITPDHEWICSFKNGRLIGSFLQSPGASTIEA